MDQLSDAEIVYLSIIEFVNYDVSLAKKVIEYVGLSRVRYQLFTRTFSTSQGDDMTARVDNAIAKSEEIFQVMP